MEINPGGRALREKISNLTGLEVYRRSSKENGPIWNNIHFTGLGKDGRKFFIKICANRPRAKIEIAVSRLLDGVRIPHPGICGFGSVEEGVYIVYEWAEMLPCSDIGAMERALKKLHGVKCPEDFGLPEYQGDIAELIADRAQDLRKYDAGTADEILEMLAGVDLRPFTEFPRRTVLLHGDLGFRNLAEDGRGNIVMYDFEHAAIGCLLFDFGKIWDREIAADGDKRRFLASYFEVSEIDLAYFENVMLPVRLWVAAGFLAYARRKNHADLERHTNRILRDIRRRIRS